MHLEINDAHAEIKSRLKDYWNCQSEENERLLLELKRAIEKREEQVRQLEHDLDQRADELRARFAAIRRAA